MRHFGTFSGVLGVLFSWHLSSSETFLKVFTRFLTFKGCFEAFSCVLICSKRFLKALTPYLTFWGILTCSGAVL